MEKVRATNSRMLNLGRIIYNIKLIDWKENKDRRMQNMVRRTKPVSTHIIALSLLARVERR